MTTRLEVIDSIQLLVDVVVWPSFSSRLTSRIQVWREEALFRPYSGSRRLAPDGACSNERTEFKYIYIYFTLSVLIRFNSLVGVGPQLGNPSIQVAQSFVCVQAGRRSSDFIEQTVP